MLRVLVLVVSIALADALNPGTVVPALYYATTDHGRRRVAAFAGAFLGVNLVAGIVLVLGPGRLLLAAVPHPSDTAKFVVEAVAGAVVLVVGLVLVARSPREAAEPEPDPQPPAGRGAGAVGATIAALELPTALPYFAAIAAIVGSGLSLASQLVLVVVFNVVFISPVLAILATLTFAGPSIEPRLRRLGDRLRTVWQRVAGLLAVVAGVLLIGFGATGLAGLH